jgi:DNA polymerase gamma 1
MSYDTFLMFREARRKHSIPLQCDAWDETRSKAHTIIDVDEDLAHCVQLPHPTGGVAAQRVGNPIVSPMKKFVDKGILHCNTKEYDEILKKIMERMYMITPWQSSQQRVVDQIVVMDETSVKQPPVGSQERHNNFLEYGAIVPKLAPAGTLTRRAVERLWMVGTNPERNRVGSELKAMVQSPPGFVFVGADVDCEEQWLAAVLGDRLASRGSGKPGSCEFSRMLLAGDKAKGTDMHSVHVSAAKLWNNGVLCSGHGIHGRGRVQIMFYYSIAEEKRRSLSQKLI